jgi:hypothetical protein
MAVGRLTYSFIDDDNFGFVGMNDRALSRKIKRKELAGIIGKSERTIKTRTVEMQEKGLIRRENGKRNGRWEVLVTI